MKRLDIAEVARQSGCPPSTLRFYEKRGLIVSDGRAGLRRQYDDSVLTRLALIALGQRAGYSLQQIAALLLPEAGRLELSRVELREQADRLREQARQLERTADLLDHVAACTAPAHLECPRFLAILDDARSARAPGDASPAPRAP